MNESSNQRLAIDLDEIERQLKQAAAPSPAGRRDPLAELARIVGQDDPFRAILAADARNAARHQAATPPGVDDRHYAAERHDPRFDDYLPEEPGMAGAQADAFHEAGHFDLPPRKPSRRKLYLVAGVMGAAVVGVSGALYMNSNARTVGGAPPVVQAEAGPVKVQPQNPGGVEIPNQNKQIYERASQEATTKVVNREELPVDVQQVARQAPRVVPLSGQGEAPAAPAPATSIVQSAAVAALGEPRRVRTVSVRPDGTVVPSETGATNASAAPVPPPSAIPLPRAVTPTVAPAAPSAPAAAARPAPSVPAPTTPAPRPVAAASTPPEAPRPARPTPPAQPQPQRVASLAPAADLAPAREAATGGFAVQIAVRGSEREAREAFTALQKKHGDELGGRAPIIRKAEVNGNTIFRVRVGPMSNDDAGSLCTRLKASGGQCFVAKN